jgi:assimilatory nitrate reductase catalytic subunit
MREALMLGWWSDIGEPEIDAGWIADAFRSPPRPRSATRCSAGKSGETALRGGSSAAA